jgi:hypothetical protein
MTVTPPSDSERAPDDLTAATRTDVWRRDVLRVLTQSARSNFLWWLLAGAVCLIVGVKLSACLPAIYTTLAAPFAMASFPFEVEWREGSFWLDALALRDKAPIYDHSVFAYVSMAHGPMDSLLKSWVSRLFPLLSPWQVTRSFVVLLPFTMVGCSIVILRGMRLPWVWGTLIGLAFYIAILAAPGGPFFLYGRTDSTGLVLCVLAITLVHLATESSHGVARSGYSFAAGVLFGASYLTIWRNFPVMGAMVLVGALAAGLQNRRWRTAGAVMLFCAAGAVAVFVAVLYGAMGGSIQLFWEHFYKLFLISYDTTASNRGFLGVPQDIWDDVVPALESLSSDRDGVIRRFAIILICPAILISTAWFPLRQRFSYLRSATYFAVLLGLYGLALLSLIAGYITHWRAGSLAYLAPIYLMSWYMICLSLIARPLASEGIRGGMSAFLTGGAVLLIAIYPHSATSASIESARVIELTDSARAFDYQLSELRKRYAVVSDGYHLFKRRLDRRNDIFDQGDVSWGFAQGGFFGPAFSDTAKRYIESLERNPPDIVIVAPISAPPIKALVEHGYTCVVCGVPFFPYGSHGFSLYARDDLPIEELRRQLSTFKSASTSAPGK